ncbi:MAG: hypothetical protein IJF13_02950 [Clostridia bacterium]|nr:hypothetical protein [Clostridia bacterium]
MRYRNLIKIMSLTDRTSIENYRHLVREGKNGENTVAIRTDAFNTALKDITANGEKVTDHREIVKTIKLRGINSDGRSTAEGTIENISIS